MRVVEEAMVAVAWQAAPELKWDEGRFRAFLRERRLAQPPFARELLLVFLWSEGDATALKTLEREYLSELPLVVGTIASDAAFVRDVVQEIKTKLYAERRLLQYRRNGPLGGWLRRVAVNTALVMKRPEARLEPLSSSYDAEALSADVELDFLKRRHRAHFREAFLKALAALSTRERTVLRLNALSNVSIDELGVMYSVHRATAARWVQRAREQLLQGTLHQLKSMLSISDDEARVLMAELRSQLDVSLRHFGAADDSPTAPPE